MRDKTYRLRRVEKLLIAAAILRRNRRRRWAKAVKLAEKEGYRHAR